MGDHFNVTNLAKANNLHPITVEQTLLSLH